MKFFAVISFKFHGKKVCLRNSYKKHIWEHQILKTDEHKGTKKYTQKQYNGSLEHANCGDLDQ